MPLRALKSVRVFDIEETGFEPSIRCEFYDHGVLIRLRFQTVPAERQLISTQIVRGILNRFKTEYDKVKFCYPHSVIRYRQDEDGDDREAEMVTLRPAYEHKTLSIRNRLATTAAERDSAIREDYASPLAEHFSVSKEAMRIRLEELGLFVERRPPSLL